MTNNSQHEDSSDILLDIKKHFFACKVEIGWFSDSLKGILYVSEQNSDEDYKQSLNNVAIKKDLDSKL